LVGGCVITCGMMPGGCVVLSCCRVDVLSCCRVDVWMSCRGVVALLGAVLSWAYGVI
jgi:hypothetical protein